MKTFVYLKGLKFYAYHGVMPQESIVGNEYTIDLKLKTDITEAARTDDVTFALDYAKVYESVRQEMLVPSHLLECAAARIVRRLFSDFPQIDYVELRLAKRNPPMGADIVEAGVQIEADRMDICH